MSFFGFDSLREQVGQFALLIVAIGAAALALLQVIVVLLVALLIRGRKEP